MIDIKVKHLIFIASKNAFNIFPKINGLVPLASTKPSKPIKPKIYHKNNIS